MKSDVERCINDSSRHGEGVAHQEGGVLGWLPLGPSIEGIGFRRAFAIGIRGTP